MKSRDTFCKDVAYLITTDEYDVSHEERIGIIFRALMGITIEDMAMYKRENGKNPDEPL